MNRRRRRIAKARRKRPDALSGRLSAGYRMGLWLRAHHDLPPILPNELRWRALNAVGIQHQHTFPEATAAQRGESRWGS